MCIICIKPAKVNFPNAKTIKTMFERNPDGAGYMWAEGGKVHIRKGFMDLNEFDTALFIDAKKHDFRDKTVVMHFRIGTAGGNTPGNTHPFPLDESVSVMHKLNSKCEIGIAHNGIIRLTPPQSAGISDTMEYIRSVLCPMQDALPYDWMYDNNMLRIIENSINGSRMVFLDKDGYISTVGRWVFHNGLWYSNYSFDNSFARG